MLLMSEKKNKWNQHCNCYQKFVQSEQLFSCLYCFPTSRLDKSIDIGIKLQMMDIFLELLTIIPYFEDFCKY